MHCSVAGRLICIACVDRPIYALLPGYFVRKKDNLITYSVIYSVIIS